MKTLILDFFNFTFGRPQVGVRSICEVLGNKIKGKFMYDIAKQTVIAELKTAKNKTNELPKTPLGEIFYYNHLTVSVLYS